MATKKFELLAKHVKSLQFVIAIACWAVVIEKDQTNEKGLYSLLEKLYLGDVNDDDTIAMHESFYDGDGRFQYMYEDQKGEKFALCFGPVIGGLSKRHFREYLDAKTVKTKNSKLVGRDIKLKADKALKEGKKYLAYWNEFLGKDGKFPSGKNEEDAMNYVLSKVQQGTNTDQEEDEDDENEDDNSPSDFSTPYMASYMLYGPYSRTWGLDICELFSVDTSAIDEKSKKKRMEKMEKKKSIDVDIDATKDNRGNHLLSQSDT